MADVTVLLTCAGQRVDIVRAFREALDAGGHDGRVLVSDLDPLSPSLFAADAVIELPLVADPGYGAAVAEACAREGVRAVLPLTDLDPVVLARAAPAIEGKANTELQRFLAAHFGVRKSAITFVRGTHARDKIVRIEGITAPP